MAESFRRMLHREYVEICAGERERWSPRMVARAARFLDRDEDQDDRLLDLAAEIVGRENGAHATLLDNDDTVRDLESRAWLLEHANAEWLGIDFGTGSDATVFAHVERMADGSLVVHASGILPGRVEQVAIETTIGPVEVAAQGRR